MAIERYLLEDQYLEPLGFALVGLELIVVEGYIYTVDGLTTSGGIMLAVGVVCLLLSAQRWTSREEMEHAEDKSIFKHVFLVAMLVIVAAQLTRFV
jgi:membrane-bound ClpP family serine protease